MKLTGIVLMGIIILSLLFSSSNTVEGLEDTNPDYTGLIVTSTQIKRLKKSIKIVESISTTEMNYIKKAELRGKIDIFIKQLDGWVERRTKYIENNNKEQIKPKKDETLDNLRDIWLGEDRKGTGIKVLFGVVIEDLEISEEKQAEIADLLKIVVKNMDAELA